VLGPEETSWTVPQAETASGVARQYTQLGIEHIWAGIDHLLFLLCLLWIAGTWRRILITITAFTLAYSLTLILSALQSPCRALVAISSWARAECWRNPKRCCSFRVARQRLPCHRRSPF